MWILQKPGMSLIAIINNNASQNVKKNLSMNEVLLTLGSFSQIAKPV